jgi:hypothetical protein
VSFIFKGFDKFFVYFIEGTEDVCVDQLQVLQEDFSNENQPPENKQSKYLWNNKILTHLLNFIERISEKASGKYFKAAFVPSLERLRGFFYF